MDAGFATGQPVGALDVMLAGLVAVVVVVGLQAVGLILIIPAAVAGPIVCCRWLRWRSREPGKLARILPRAERDALLRPTADKHWALTERGEDEAIRMVRNHRLWEMYPITHADIAPQHVDRDADRIEHVLSPEMISELETLVERDDQHPAVPPSPHEIVSIGVAYGNSRT
ncbi:MAG: metal-dependent transcriptional regulator [Gammaproteobacteria bacterium]